ncbi:DUF5924 family protein [Gaopeijia maritima]|uniref:DUF5924 family protein n=1 Tax=Gaopeijia maritima TaxID=3119007 RepID=A0ABU9E9T8_9BACT
MTTPSDSRTTPDDRGPDGPDERGPSPPETNAAESAGPPPGAHPIATAAPDEESPERLTFRERSGRFWARHRTLFWMLHSVWALATGIVVVTLAQERYAFVPWVIGFLGVTWASTLFFGSSAEHEIEEEAEQEAAERRATGAPPAPGLAQEVTGYVTRSLYQETLFFLLPFYAYSTVVTSVNVLFIALLGGLAVLSCLDLVFDRWLRTKPVFAMIFFAIVAFAAVNLILPMLWAMPPRLATPIAGVVAVGSAVPLALRTGSVGRGAALRMAVAVLAILAVPLGLPSVVPPVPLRMQSAVFSNDIDRETLALGDSLSGGVDAAVVGSRLVVLVEVFAPGSVPTTVRLQWTRDGEPVHQSREVEILAHEWRFRVWDAWPAPGGQVPPGHYVVTLRTGSGRIFGVTDLTVR